MSRFMLPMIVLGCVFVVLTQQVHAHRPVFTDDAATSPDTAVSLSEPDVSQVVYREITADSPQVWLGFDVPEDFELYVQIGVPVLDRLKDFRPAMAVVGPGLLKEDLPFAIPGSTGAKVLTTDDVEQPRLFHEHFTDTKSWILRSETVPLSQAGRYYLVAFVPERESTNDSHEKTKQQTGKLWLSIGRKESFTLKDWQKFPTWRELIREFHEAD